MSDQDKIEKEALDIAGLLKANITIICKKYEETLKENERLRKEIRKLRKETI